MRRVFICGVVPPEIVKKYPATQAGNTFSFNFIKGDVFDYSYSIPPTNVREDFSSYSSEKILYISKMRRHRGILKYFSVVLENFAIFKKLEKGDNVWFYNITWASLILFFLTRFALRNSSANVIVADYSPPKGLDVVSRLCGMAIKRANHIITLAESVYFKDKKIVCIPGIAPAIGNQKENNVKREFLLSGFLVENRGFPKILEWFAKHPSCILNVCGNIPLRDVLSVYASKYSNIKDLGFLTYEKYIEVLRNSGICLNTRDPSFAENYENFPSKMIEYLLFNKVVVSTMRYPQLDTIGVKYIYSHLEEDEFMGTLENLLVVSNSEILIYANQGELIQNNFSSERWKKEMTRLEMGYI